MNEKPFARTDRVGALIQEELSALLRKSINDPRLTTALITGVKMSSDLKLAKIYFVISDRVSTRDAAFAGFEKAKGFIKYSLAQTLKLRYMPEFRFYYDNSMDYGFHMDSVLDKLKHEHSTNHRPTEEE
jgi:ribosome-binding factor A